MLAPPLSCRKVARFRSNAPFRVAAGFRSAALPMERARRGEKEREARRRLTGATAAAIDVFFFFRSPTPRRRRFVPLDLSLLRSFSLLAAPSLVHVSTMRSCHRA